MRIYVDWNNMLLCILLSQEMITRHNWQLFVVMIYLFLHNGYVPAVAINFSDV